MQKEGTPLSRDLCRALDLAYESERMEREERRGLETRAATTIGGTLVLVTVLATVLSRIRVERASGLIAL